MRIAFQCQPARVGLPLAAGLALRLVIANADPQYYQSPFFPLAPTLGHVVFIVGAEIVLAPRLLGVVVPEYVQYPTATYIVLRFLAGAAFGWVCRLPFRRLRAVTLGTVAFEGRIAAIGANE